MGTIPLPSHRTPLRAIQHGLSLLTLPLPSRPSLCPASPSRPNTHTTQTRSGSQFLASCSLHLPHEPPLPFIAHLRSSLKPSHLSTLAHLGPGPSRARAGSRARRDLAS